MSMSRCKYDVMVVLSDWIVLDGYGFWDGCAK